MIPFVGTPIWLASLILAAIAPFCVRSVADAIERSTRRRTLRILTEETPAGAQTRSSGASAASGRAEATGDPDVIEPRRERDDRNENVRGGVQP